MNTSKYLKIGIWYSHVLEFAILYPYQIGTRLRKSIEKCKFCVWLRQFTFWGLEPTLRACCKALHQSDIIEMAWRLHCWEPAHISLHMLPNNEWFRLLCDRTSFSVNLLTCNFSVPVCTFSVESLHSCIANNMPFGFWDTQSNDVVCCTCTDLHNTLALVWRCKINFVQFVLSRPRIDKTRNVNAFCFSWATL